ncbi:unnamed protein product [Paramecium sonneborni]|uniref:Uncharacterized protein n=1 Tax=Paramecium sonneborni TaxID=65129 RepID=A0A8S1RC82_9CILI|nr:unnamed protein product [Paramecium sonneborni]
MRPIVSNTELAFIKPTNIEKKVSLKRKMKTSDECVKNARSRYQELFYQQEANLEYLYDQLSERIEKYTLQKQKQLANKAKYACDYNFRWKQRLQEQKWLDIQMSREFYFQELHFQEFKKRHSRSKSLALPKIEIKKKTEPCPITKKKEDYNFDKQRKVIYCSYQRDLKQMKRSFEIASKLDQDDQRIMKQKTLDIKPKPKLQYKQDDNTFLTYI